MGFYRSLLLEEELDSVQDPDNTGVDLDQIEQDIVGDGNEAHSEEIDAAVDGVIDDPLEEAFMIMYESEVNYNKLLQAIGMQEIQEAARGRDFILESGNIKAFFDRVIEIVKQMFTSITKAFQSVLIKLRSMNVGGKQFVNKNKEAITKGASKLSKDHSNFKRKVYEYPEIKFKAEDSAELNKYLNGFTSRTTGDIDSANFAKTVKSMKHTILRTYFVGSYAGSRYDFKGIESVSDLQKKSYEVLRGEEVDNPFSNIGKYIEILSKDKEGGDLTKQYYTLKASYKEALSKLNNMKKQAIKDASDESAKKGIGAIANGYSDLIKFKQNCLNSVFSVFMKVSRQKFSQAMAIAKACVSAYNKKEKLNDSAIYSGSSMSSIFSNIEFA